MPEPGARRAAADAGRACTGLGMGVWCASREDGLRLAPRLPIRFGAPREKRTSSPPCGPDVTNDPDPLYLPGPGARPAAADAALAPGRDQLFAQLLRGRHHVLQRRFDLLVAARL